MATASTKSRKDKQQRAATPAQLRSPAQMLETAVASEISRRSWLIAGAVIVLLAAVLRFYDLDLVPLHHDEGVNGNFLVQLVRDGRYVYDPANYHGPTLYYFAAWFPRLLRWLFGPQTQNSVGLTTTAVRAVPAIFGVGTVALILTLRRNLGAIATLAAAALLAISPGAVYLSRYFIHESQFVFFTLAVVVGLLKFYEGANPLYLLVAAFSAGLLFATKETAFISIAVLAIALPLTIFYRRLLPADAPPPRKAGRKSGSDATTSFVERAGGGPHLAIWIVIAVAIFVVVNVLFYSSFFHNFPKGVRDSIRTFEFWQKTGKKDHVKPMITYVWWLLLQEAPLILLGAIGAMLSVLKPARSFALFSALWAFGLIAAYSLVSYKTPWLALNFIVPLALASGYAVEWFVEELRSLVAAPSLRIAALALVLVCAMGVAPGLMRAHTKNRIHKKTFLPGYQTYDLNFQNYDNDDEYYVYVYAHTRRDLLKMINEIDRIAGRTHQGGQTGITIVAPEYWPLPWYLRDYSRVGYFGRMNQSNEPIIVASQAQAGEVETTFGDRYQLVHSGLNATGSYSLRPGVDLLLFTRRELVK